MQTPHLQSLCPHDLGCIWPTPASPADWAFDSWHCQLISSSITSILLCLPWTFGSALLEGSQEAGLLVCLLCRTSSWLRGRVSRGMEQSQWGVSRFSVGIPLQRIFIAGNQFLHTSHCVLSVDATTPFPLMLTKYSLMGMDKDPNSSQSLEWGLASLGL